MTTPSKSLFAQFPAVARPTSPIEPLGNAGGLSGSRLYRFRSGLGPLVARLWPVDGPDLRRLSQLHSWLKKTEGLEFVPLPIPTLDGRTFVILEGRSWEIAPWMPGVADPNRPPMPIHLLTMFGGLAAFLARLAPGRIEGPSPGLLLRIEEIDRLRFGEFDELRTLANRSPLDPASALTLSWLEKATNLAPSIAERTRQAASRPLPLQPCLRDARPDHFLWEGDRLTGLVDFGAMDRDSVAGDLARLLAEGVGPDRLARSKALEAFEAILPLNQAEHRAIETFQAANALLGAGRWARWHFLEPRTFDDPTAVVRGLRKGLERLGEAS